MPGISDSGNPDDIRIHLEEIGSANARRAEPESGETEAETETRLSVLLPPALAARLDSVVANLREAVPGLGAVEGAKILATRHARNALRAGKEALSRVDSHLQAVTGTVNPQLGRNYGVYGRNPESFAGVYRSLEQSAAEDERIRSLPEDAPDRARLFTPVVARAIETARGQLRGLLGDSLAARAEWSRNVAVKDEVLSEAKSVIGAVRNHLYANLALRKRDPDLRDYGFRPVRTGRGRSVETDDNDADDDSSEE